MAITLSDNCSYFTLQVGVHNIDTDAFAPMSKVQTVDYYQKCARNSVYLTWLNSLGMWEYWDFQGQTDRGFDVTNSQTAKKNTFEDWDNNFINQETEEFYRYVEAYERELVRTQRLSDSNALAISRIKYAIQVQEIKIDNTKVTVLVDKSGGFFSRDNRKGTEFGITIRRTSQIPIQGQ